MGHISCSWVGSEQNEPLALPFYFLFSLISLGSKTASLDSPRPTG